MTEHPWVDNGKFVDLTRLKDGRIMCSICFEYRHTEDLEPVADEPGRFWDVCKGDCAHQAGLPAP
jgi:hypothetical protein